MAEMNDFDRGILEKIKAATGFELGGFDEFFPDSGLDALLIAFAWNKNSRGRGRGGIGLTREEISRLVETGMLTQTTRGGLDALMVGIWNNDSEGLGLGVADMDRLVAGSDLGRVLESGDTALLLALRYWRDNGLSISEESMLRLAAGSDLSATGVWDLNAKGSERDPRTAFEMAVDGNRTEGMSFSGRVLEALARGSRLENRFSDGRSPIGAVLSKRLSEGLDVGPSMFDELLARSPRRDSEEAGGTHAAALLLESPLCGGLAGGADPLLTRERLAILLSDAPVELLGRLAARKAESPHLAGASWPVDRAGELAAHAAATLDPAMIPAALDAGLGTAFGAGAVEELAWRVARAGEGPGRSAMTEALIGAGATFSRLSVREFGEFLSSIPPGLAKVAVGRFLTDNPGRDDMDSGFPVGSVDSDLLAGLLPSMPEERARRLVGRTSGSRDGLARALRAAGMDLTADVLDLEAALARGDGRTAVDSLVKNPRLAAETLASGRTVSVLRAAFASGISDAPEMLGAAGMRVSAGLSSEQVMALAADAVDAANPAAIRSLAAAGVSFSRMVDGAGFAELCARTLAGGRAGAAVALVEVGCGPSVDEAVLSGLTRSLGSAPLSAAELVAGALLRAQAAGASWSDARLDGILPRGSVGAGLRAELTRGGLDGARVGALVSLVPEGSDTGPVAEALAEMGFSTEAAAVRFGRAMAGGDMRGAVLALASDRVFLERQGSGTVSTILDRMLREGDAGAAAFMMESGLDISGELTGARALGRLEGLIAVDRVASLEGFVAAGCSVSGREWADGPWGALALQARTPPAMGGAVVERIAGLLTRAGAVPSPGMLAGLSKAAGWAGVEASVLPGMVDSLAKRAVGGATGPSGRAVATGVEAAELLMGCSPENRGAVVTLLSERCGSLACRDEMFSSMAAALAERFREGAGLGRAGEPVARIPGASGSARGVAGIPVPGDFDGVDFTRAPRVLAALAGTIAALDGTDSFARMVERTGSGGFGEASGWGSALDAACAAPTADVMAVAMGWIGSDRLARMMWDLPGEATPDGWAKARMLLAAGGRGWDDESAGAVSGCLRKLSILEGTGLGRALTSELGANMAQARAQVAGNADAFQVATMAVADDGFLAGKAVEANPSVFARVSSRLRHDFGFCLDAFQRDPSVFHAFPEALKARLGLSAENCAKVLGDAVNPPLLAFARKKEYAKIRDELGGIARHEDNARREAETWRETTDVSLLAVRISETGLSGRELAQADAVLAKARRLSGRVAAADEAEFSKIVSRNMPSLLEKYASLPEAARDDAGEGSRTPRGMLRDGLSSALETLSGMEERAVSMGRDAVEVEAAVLAHGFEAFRRAVDSMEERTAERLEELGLDRFGRTRGPAA